MSKRKSAVLLATEINLARVSVERDAAALALSDVIGGRVTWFKNEFAEIAVSRENGAHGGLIVYRLVGSNYSQAYFFESWFTYWRNYIPAANDAEGVAVRNLAFSVMNHIREKQETARRAEGVR
jgi:hypothetical protein